MGLPFAAPSVQQLDRQQFNHEQIKLISIVRAQYPNNFTDAEILHFADLVVDLVVDYQAETSITKLSSNDVSELYRRITSIRAGDWSNWSYQDYVCATFMMVLIFKLVLPADAFQAQPRFPNFFQSSTTYDPRSNLGSNVEEMSASSGQSHLTAKKHEETDQGWPYERSKTHRYFDMQKGLLDVEKFQQEVARQAIELGNPNYFISKDRILQLSTERGEITFQSSREAMSIIKGEILGFWKDSYRPDYGLVQGPDFIVTGLDKFQPITHVEIKNPVGTKILRNTNQLKTVYKQGVSIGGRSAYQRILWSDPARREKVENYDAASIKSAFPKTPENMLVVVDLDDVPKFEQGDVIKGIQKKGPDFITLQK